MNKYDLSILIPARNEMFVSRTVENLLKNIRGNTEIIVALDGQWADPGIPDDPRVTILYLPQAIGQRAATNAACRLSKAEYVMKLDAHCAVDEGFDVKLLKDMQPDWTVVPMMYNLHAFDWVCDKCGNKWYQSPSPQYCRKDYDDNEKAKNPNCDNTTAFHREIIFAPRLHKKSLYYRFDKTLHFQYWGDFNKRVDAQGDIVEIMSIQGSCFMLSRKRYWELNICDEAHGSWGQQGVEVAMKTWLSGGRLVVNKRTWYAHMFRTQGGDFGFPYPLSEADVKKAREYSRELWLQNTWPLRKKGRDLEWLLEKFRPVPDWHYATSGGKKVSKGAIYYTHGSKNSELLEACRQQIKRGMKEKHIVSCSPEPLKFGKQNIVLPAQPKPAFLDMCKRIVACLEALDTEIVFFLEHDVMYNPTHFDFVPIEANVYYYNTNVWRVRASDGLALWCDELRQLSGLVAYRETVLENFRKRIKVMEQKAKELSEEDYNRYVRAMGFEPGTHGRPEKIDDLKAENYFAQYPNLDIRHDSNATPSRWTKEQFKNEKYTRGWKEKNVFELEGWEEEIIAPLIG